MSRWLATPFVNFQLGTGTTYTTLGIGKRKFIQSLNITQLAKNTIKFDMTLQYTPPTFASGAPNLVELQMVEALSDNATRDIELCYGYVSNSPYTGGGETSPIYKGFLTNIESSVGENTVTYNISGYGKEKAFDFFSSNDIDLYKEIKPTTNLHYFIKHNIFKNGKITAGNETYHFNIEIEGVPNITFWELLVVSMGLDNYTNVPNTGLGILNNSLSLAQSVVASVTNTTRSISTGSDLYKWNTGQASEAMKDRWNKAKDKLNFKVLANDYFDTTANIIGDSATNNAGRDESKYSAFAALTLVNRLLNYYNGSNFTYSIQNYGSNDGTIRIFDMNKTQINSKKVFTYGIWSGSYPTVISWSCNYNATAKMYGYDNSGSKIKSYSNAETMEALTQTIGSDLEQALSAEGEFEYGLINSQTQHIDITNDKIGVLQSAQYLATLQTLQNIFDYPYEATLTVLGIVDPFDIVKDTVEVVVCVNGAPHHTSGRYLVRGVSHNLISPSEVFTTTLQLIKLGNHSVSELTSAKIVTIDDDTGLAKVNRATTYSN